MLSPLLWLLVVNEILQHFQERRTKVVAYADDIVILITGKFLQTISDLMETALGNISTWAGKNGLGVNPSKTEIVLFTRRTKIPEFRRPRLNGITLSLSSEAKYLGIILDSKLSWKRNIEERTRKGLAAFGENWGLSPYITHGLYKTVVRPVTTYGALVWWKALEKETNRRTMYKVQRLASLGVTGAARSAPQEGLNMILHLIPLQIHTKGLAAKAAVRLREAGSWHETRSGHATILEDIERSCLKCSLVSLKVSTDRPNRPAESCLKCSPVSLKVSTDRPNRPAEIKK